MELDNFSLEKYNQNNRDHEDTIIELCQDKDVKAYLGDLFYAMKKIDQRREINTLNDAYIAYYDDQSIGYMSITTKNHLYEISCGLKRQYRGQYLGSMLLQEFSEKIFEMYPQVNELSLSIHDLNERSKSAAVLGGYEREENRYVQRRM